MDSPFDRVEVRVAIARNEDSLVGDALATGIHARDDLGWRLRHSLSVLPVRRGSTLDAPSRLRFLSLNHPLCRFNIYFNLIYVPVLSLIITRILCVA